MSGKGEQDRTKKATKCPKCHSIDIREKNVRLAGTFGMFIPLEATAHICESCGYIEFYKR